MTCVSINAMFGIDFKVWTSSLVNSTGLVVALELLLLPRSPPRPPNVTVPLEKPGVIVMISPPSEQSVA